LNPKPQQVIIKTRIVA